MKTIYQHLGNAVRHKKTMKFIYSDFDINMLKKED